MSQRPYVARTWAPRGQTPLLLHRGGWKRLSAAAGATRRARLYPGSIKAAQMIHFLSHLRRQIRGPILLVWDRLGVHRSRAVRQWFAGQGDRFLIEQLPAYVPELNPVEYLMGWWKKHAVANACPPPRSNCTGWPTRDCVRPSVKEPPWSPPFGNKLICASKVTI